MQYFQVGENDTLKRRIYLHLVDATDGITPETGEAGGRAKVSINGKAPANSVSTLVAVDSTNQPGTYYLELSPSELQFPGVVIVRYKSVNTAEFVALGQVMAFDPYTQYGQFSGAAGVDVDYKKIQKMVSEAVTRIPIPEVKEVDLVPVSEGLQAVIQEIRDIKLPEQRETDFRPILVKLEVMQRLLSNFTFPETDLSPVIKKIDDLTEELNPLFEESKQTAEQTKKEVSQTVETGMKKLGKTLTDLKDKFEDIPYVVMEIKDKQPESKKKPNVLEEYLKLK